MTKNAIKDICLSLLAIFIIFSPIQPINALSPDCIGVPKLLYGTK